MPTAVSDIARLLVVLNIFHQAECMQKAWFNPSFLYGCTIVLYIDNQK